MRAVTSGGGLERDCCFSQRTADKAFGRKGLANDCIPRNPWTAIFTPKELPIVSFCSGRSRKDWFGPRLWSPSRSSHPSCTSCSVCTSMQGPRDPRVKTQQSFRFFPRMCVKLCPAFCSLLSSVRFKTMSRDVPAENTKKKPSASWLSRELLGLSWK